MRVPNFLLTALAIVVALWIAMIAIVWAVQERMVWLPPRVRVAEPAGVARVDFTTPDGQRLFYYRVASAAPSDSAPIVLAFHGNADLASLQVPWARELVERTDAIVVLAEYRGYAGLPGRPTYAGSRADALATWREVERRERGAASRALFLGHSLGSAVAAELASEVAPRALLLESPFISARALAARMPFPGVTLLWNAIARVRFDTRARVAALDVPVWVAHGDADPVIPVAMGREVHAAARRRGALAIVPGAGHNDLREHPAYWEWLERAVRGVTV